MYNAYRLLCAALLLLLVIAAACGHRAIAGEVSMERPARVSPPPG